MRDTKGNALFLILIAVALFAALSYAVSKGGRGGGSINKEQAELVAAQLLQNASSVQVMINRLVISGTPADNIEFTALTCDSGAPDSNCCVEVGATGEECTSGNGCVFAPENGGIAFPHLPPAAEGTNSTVVMQQCYYPIEKGVSWISTSAPDIYHSIDDVDEEVCRAVNRKLGVDPIPVEGAWTGHPFGCYRSNWAGGYYFFLYAFVER